MREGKEGQSRDGKEEDNRGVQEARSRAMALWERNDYNVMETGHWIPSLLVFLYEHPLSEGDAFSVREMGRHLSCMS